MEEEEEQKMILHGSVHEHPLTLIPTTDNRVSCCLRHVLRKTVYECADCRMHFHEECAEMPSKIRHPIHPQHTLKKHYLPYYYGRLNCAVCERSLTPNSYLCSVYACRVALHLACAPVMGVVVAAEEEEGKKSIRHPSHPLHELRPLRRRHSFRCDACGTLGNGNSYICSICQFWIHDSCASLPLTQEFTQHHPHHSLSLAFDLPKRYIKFGYKCDICNIDFLLKHWVYHCDLCSYVVHIKCAMKSSPDTTLNAPDLTAFLEFPIMDVFETLIKPFIMRNGGDIVIAHDEVIKDKYWSHLHHHPLTLVSSEDNKNDNYDGDDDDGPRAELICDGCTTPIYKRIQESSSPSSSSDKYYYYSCGECKYFLHFACFHVPREIAHHRIFLSNAKLTLRTCPDFRARSPSCSVCRLDTNGLFYYYKHEGFCADIKCASLPRSIKHASHPRHLLHISRESQRGCSACGVHFSVWGNGLPDYCYKCDHCESFILCCRCVLLPPVIEHRGDKHPLPLTYDANLNHPGEFYCDFCEQEMDPKRWMYHCRDCDHSFHPGCIPDKSGGLRNVTFGQHYAVASTLHPHPLVYRLITIKLRCDVCGGHVYGDAGFVCETCNFVMCSYKYSDKHRDAVELIH